MAKPNFQSSMTVDEFYNNFLNNKDIVGEYREARLIPHSKTSKSEIAITSVFLSSLKYIKEFRKMVIENLDIKSSNKTHVFTEVSFVQFEDLRIDGLLCVEKGGKIVDVAIFEMKNGANTLEADQINAYLNIAKAYNILKMVTVSNQFVSNPKQTPLEGLKKNGKINKNIDLYHLSWTYILTMAYILLTDNETNIADEDQINIMREVVAYFEHDSSGLKGFTIMDGWKDIFKKIKEKGNIKKDDADAVLAVKSWLQEERDMALLLSRKLGVLVGSGKKDYATDLQRRIEVETKNLIEKKCLESSFKIKGSPFSINVLCDFCLENIFFSVKLDAPMEATLKGELGKIKKSIIDPIMKDEVQYNKLKDNLKIDLQIKSRSFEKFPLNDYENFLEENKNNHLSKFGFTYCLDTTFSQPQKIIEKMEKALVDFYSGVVLHLKVLKTAREIKNPEA